MEYGFSKGEGITKMIESTADVVSTLKTLGMVKDFIIMGVSIGVFAGILKTNLKYISDQIKRLEIKQDKHNGLIERMVVVEQSSRSAHHRLDTLETRIENIDIIERDRDRRESLEY